MSLLAKLRELDELELIELLKLTSDDIVDAFTDRIEELEEELIEKTREVTLHGYQEE